MKIDGRKMSTKMYIENESIDGDYIIQTVPLAIFT